jgi:prolipoprotein diacylglyceryltransferase
MIEALRTDSLMMFGMKTAQLISVVLIVGSLIAWFLKEKYLLKEEPIEE